MAQTFDLRIQGLRFLGGVTTLDGSNPTSVDVSASVSSILVAQATMSGSGATGADPNQITVLINGTSADIYAWKVTTGGASGNPTEIASTDNARVINYFIIGVDLPRKGS